MQITGLANWAIPEKIRKGGGRVAGGFEGIKFPGLLQKDNVEFPGMFNFKKNSCGINF